MQGLALLWIIIGQVASSELDRICWHAESPVDRDLPCSPTEHMTSDTNITRLGGRANMCKLCHWHRWLRCYPTSLDGA